MHMMDVREATNTLNAYSTSIIGKTRFCEKVSNPGASEEVNKLVEELFTTLEAEAKEAMIISIMILRHVAQHSEQFAIGFTDELTELTEALNRSRAATDDACKLTLAHNEQSQRREPEENPTVKAIREFRAKHGLRSN
jgi:hypothetical protein